MKNFNRGGGFGDRKNSGGFGRRDSGGRDFNRGGGDFGRPEMHKATCADCGQSCEVPFKPTGDKPVYCSNCFKGKENAGPSRSGGRDFNRGDRGDRGGRDFSRPSFGDKQLFKATCDDCGQECEVPFRPSAGKPVYCSNCFGKSDKAKTHAVSPANDQFEMLNAKLDKIMRALNINTSAEAVVKKEVVVKEVLKVVAKPVVKEIKKVEFKLEPKSTAKKIIKKIVASKIVAPKKKAKK